MRYTVRGLIIGSMSLFFSFLLDVDPFRVGALLIIGGYVAEFAFAADATPQMLLRAITITAGSTAVLVTIYNLYRWAGVV